MTRRSAVRFSCFENLHVVGRKRGSQRETPRKLDSQHLQTLNARRGTHVERWHDIDEEAPLLVLEDGKEGNESE